MVNHLIFDASDAISILDSSNVGAYVRASDGSLITSTTVGADIGLDVNIINASIAVTATNLDIRDLTAVSDSIQAWAFDGTGNAITSTLGALDVNIKSPIVVDVSTSHVNDSMRLGDGTSFFTSTTVGADIGLDVNLINASIAVTATNLDIRDLTAASDSIQAWAFDGAGTALTSTLVGADQALDVNIVNTLTVTDAALANVAIQQSAAALAVANTAQTVVASVLANRKYLRLYNDGKAAIFVGDATVTAANGYPIFPGSEIDLRLGAAVVVDFVGQTGKLGNDAKLRALQLS